MRIDFIDGNRVGITLSRRNLRALLAKLDGNPPDSACTIAKDDDIGFLTVRAEEDDPHYDETHSGYGPGAMHPATEAAMIPGAQEIIERGFGPPALRPPKLDKARLKRAREALKAGDEATLAYILGVSVETIQRLGGLQPKGKQNP